MVVGRNPVISLVARLKSYKLLKLPISFGIGPRMVQSLMKNTSRVVERFPIEFGRTVFKGLNDSDNCWRYLQFANEVIRLNWASVVSSRTTRLEAFEIWAGITPLILFIPSIVSDETLKISHGMEPRNPFISNLSSSSSSRLPNSFGRSAAMGMYCLANQLKAWNRRSAIKIRVMRTYCVIERRGSTQVKSFKCNEIPDGSVRKYKLRVRVVDMKGTASFLIWDRECVDLLGIPAEDLYERNLNNLGNIKEILELKGRTMLFKISAKKEHYVRRNIPFPVVKIKTDQLLLQQLCPDLLALDENDFNSDGQISEGDDKFLEGFESDEGESPIALLPPTSSTDCTTDGPVKRCLLDSFSSTKGGKKVKQSHVKLEKID
nr:replication factor A protein 1-like [Ipomoea batatas]